jgi:acid phosphatase type 7
VSSRTETDRGTRRRTLARVAGVLGSVAFVIAIGLLVRSCTAPVDLELRAVAVGDMACDPTDPAFADGSGTDDRCQQAAVSDLAVALAPEVLLGLGDYQYELPTKAAYEEVYGPTWGRLREITRPALGNQELKVFNANTFRDYFGELAGPEQGYWSFDEGAWHVVVLNSNCTTVVGGCAEGSPQHDWLRADLAAAASRCVVAMWHHPRFSNGIAGPDKRTQDLYAALVEYDVELVLSGHEAHYERFARLDQLGRPDQRGPRQFVVGTGGQVTYEPAVGDAPWRQKLAPVASESVDFADHGVLLLDLRDGDYSWQFRAVDASEPRGRVVDSGTDTCH